MYNEVTAGYDVDTLVADLRRPIFILNMAMHQDTPGATTRVLNARKEIDQRVRKYIKDRPNPYLEEIENA